jgi:hypothetical protein
MRLEIFIFLLASVSSAVAGRRLLLNPPIKDLSSSTLRDAYATWFDGCYVEGCGCGVPPELLVDLEGNRVPYVALNVQNSDIYSGKLSRPINDKATLGLYNNGKNCGRWIEITYGENCVNHGHEVKANPPIVCGVNAFTGSPLQNFQKDGKTGTKAYAVVADSCQDGNFWCREGVPVSSSSAGLAATQLTEHL